MEWQPIETAPFSTWVLVFRPQTSLACKMGVDYKHKQDGWVGNPTHWMPLPEPPK